MARKPYNDGKPVRRRYAGRKLRDPKDRIEDRIERVTESGCWLWLTGDKGEGYGSGYINGKGTQAHRMVYQVYKGPIPEGMTIDHLCRVRCCVNPEHLEAVPQRVNILRGISPVAKNAKKTRCVAGHDFDEKNTYVRPDGRRQCRACSAIQLRRVLLKKVLAAENLAI